MPNYDYQCVWCAHSETQNRMMANRDRVQMCPACDRGWLQRGIAAGTLVDRSTNGSPASNREQEDREIVAQPRVPNVTMIDCVIDNCGGGIKAEGGHIVVNGLNVTNTPTVFDLSGGATVDADRIRHDVGPDTLDKEEVSPS